MAEQDCCSRAGLRRRSVLQGLAVGGGLAALGGPAAGPAAAAPRLALAAPGYTGDVLVVLSLRGGFDGLSAVVPAADPDYVAARGPLAVPVGQLLQLDARFGLHPAMKPLKPFWDNRSLAFVHAVGQADPSRSHFEAMAEMERAAPGTSLRSGWLDRTIGLQPPGNAFAATQLSWGGVTGALMGPNPETVMPNIDSFQIDGARWSDGEGKRWYAALAKLHEGVRPELAQPAAAAMAGARVAAGLVAHGYTPAGGADYGSSDLGKALRDVARLIKAGVGLRVACVEQDDWDMHADLGTIDSGRMKNNLTDLAGAVAAFATDLGPLLSGVTVVTLSEFGRRVAQNGTGGVDHGHGNAVLLLGGGTVGGTVHGSWPGLAADALVDGDLAGTTDYRAILGELLQKRCGIGDLAGVFPDYRGTALGVTTPRS